MQYGHKLHLCYNFTKTQQKHHKMCVKLFHAATFNTQFY